MVALRGWWNMSCWNALSADQQRRLIEVGNLEIFTHPEGHACNRGAQVAIETEHDLAPGPRFYCRPCAVAYLLRIDIRCGHSLCEHAACYGVGCSECDGGLLPWCVEGCYAPG